MIDRTEVEEILAEPVEGDSIEERNAARRLAVENWLNGRPEGTQAGLQGRSVKDMILSDLHSYSEWERE